MTVSPYETDGNTNESILAQLLEDAQGDIEGAVRTDQKPLLQEVISRGDDEYGSVMVAKVYQDAGVAPIYDLRTGQRSLCPVNLLPANLQKVDADGKRMFTSRRPSTPNLPDQRHKCMLHLDARQPEYDTWGLPVCMKDNIADPLNLELHMQHRHPAAWAIIERDRARKEKAEEREWQRQIAMAAVAGQTRTPDTAVAEPVAAKKKAS